MPNQLWAPWRYDYIRTADQTLSASGCIFCSIFAAADDRANLLLYRGKSCFVLLNAYPYTSGHLMVSPNRHVADLSQLDDLELLELNKLVAKSVAWTTAAYGPHGFNVGMNLGKAAGAGIPDHLHCHVVPRWEGDTNFMTPIGNVRVIPQSLEDSYDLVRVQVDA